MAGGFIVCSAVCDKEIFVKRLLKLYLCLSLGAVAPVQAGSGSLVDMSAKEDSVAIYLATEKGPGKYIGNIHVRQTRYGIVFEPSLSSLKAGLHGFHVHEDPSCDPNEKDAEHEEVPAGKAGDHFDARSVDTHGGPWGVGHVGDLPMLYVDQNGKAEYPVLAPRLKMEFLKGRSLLIHANPDNYTDSPPKGGSGPRVACGIFFAQELEEPVKRESEIR
jgi:Cu-Zn family superoxide dismutase